MSDFKVKNCIDTSLDGGEPTLHFQSWVYLPGTPDIDVGYVDGYMLSRLSLDDSIKNEDLSAFLKLKPVRDILDKEQSILYINMVKVEPPYRGTDIGLDAVRNVSRVIGRGVCWIAMKPCPPVGTYGKGKKDFDSGKQKLRKYWRKLGVHRIGKSDFYWNVLMPL